MSELFFLIVALLKMNSADGLIQSLGLQARFLVQSNKNWKLMNESLCSATKTVSCWIHNLSAEIKQAKIKKSSRISCVSFLSLFGNADGAVKELTAFVQIINTSKCTERNLNYSNYFAFVYWVNATS